MATPIAELKKVVGLRDNGRDFLDHVKGYVEKLCAERGAVPRRAEDVRKRRRGAEVVLGRPQHVRDSLLDRAKRRVEVGTGAGSRKRCNHYMLQSREHKRD